MRPLLSLSLSLSLSLAETDVHFLRTRARNLEHELVANRPDHGGKAGPLREKRNDVGVDVVRERLAERERHANGRQQRDAVRRDDDVARTDRLEELAHRGHRHSERAVLERFKKADVHVVQIWREDFDAVALFAQSKHELLVTNCDAASMHRFATELAAIAEKR